LLVGIIRWDNGRLKGSSALSKEIRKEGTKHWPLATFPSFVGWMGMQGSSASPYCLTVLFVCNFELNALEV